MSEYIDVEMSEVCGSVDWWAVRHPFDHGLPIRCRLNDVLRGGSEM